MDLEVRHLTLVKAVAEEGSVSKAAIHLHLTQSALSHQLRTIEGRLGAPLFLRHNRRMVLSRPGERLLRSAERVLGELKSAEEDIRRIATNREGVLRISTECYTSYHWLPAVFKVFAAKYPNIELQVIAEATMHPVEYLVERKLDVAIVPGVIRERRVVIEPLFHDKLVVIMHPDHPLAAKRYVAPEDFADQHLFMYTEYERTGELFYYRSVLAPAGVTPRHVTYMQLSEGIIEMVKTGLGIAVLAHWAVDPEIKKRTIKALPLTKKGCIRQWNAATLRGAPRPPHLDAFIRMLANRKMPAMKYY